MTARILVAGIGNIFLGDDGFGPEVMRRVVGQSLGADVHPVDYGIRGMHLAYDLLEEWRALVIVDEGMGLSEPFSSAVPAAVAAIHDVLADLFARTTATAEG